MAKQRHLNKAPIVEAVVDLVVEPPCVLDDELQKRLVERLGDGYSLKGHVQRGQFSFNPKLGATAGSHLLGYRFHSTDEKFVAQFQVERFTLSRLTPYTTWEQLRDEAMRLWPIYVNALEPKLVSRAACRYINNLQLPMQLGQDFKVFLESPPEVPKDLPQGLLSFMQRFVIAYPDHGAITTLTQVLEPNAALNLERVPVILDIDVHCQRQFEPNCADIWECLERLRGLKNDAFFASITETAAELYA